MPRPPLLFALALALALAVVTACGESSPPRTPVVPVEARRRAAEVLLWTQATGDAPSTVRLAEGGDVVEHLPGIRIATRRGEWAWTTTEIPFATVACEQGFPPGPGRLTRGSFVRDGETQVVIDQRAGALEDANEITDDVRVVGSLGPLVFVERHTSVFACGAHGATESSFLVWDLERSEPFDVVAALGDPGPLVARAREQLGHGRDLDQSVGEEVAVQVTELLPVAQRDARGELELRFQAQVTAPACFACGDGLWSSYTRSVRVETQAPRAVLVRGGAAAVPSAVRAYARKYPSAAVRGWSEVAFPPSS